MRKKSIILIPFIIIPLFGIYYGISSHNIYIFVLSLLVLFSVILIAVSRSETVIEKATGNKITSKFILGKLIKSTMVNKDGNKIYEIKYYKLGKISKTRNYNDNGNVNIVQTFYKNGEVHYRKEFNHISGDIKITEYDINGNKI